jgi:uncharacterized protein YciU (UPF0263 family)
MVKKYRVLIALLLFIVAASVVSILVYKHCVQGSSASAVLPKSNYTIMTDKVNIEATVEHVGDEEVSSRHEFEFTLTVGKGTESYHYESADEECNTINEVITKLKSSIVWKDNYLLVPVSCGGGNAARCEIMQIFMVLNDHLVHVGEAGVGTDDDYSKGKFHDIYDKLEMNDLTCHADAPLFTIILYERNGSMAVQLAETWDTNLEMYKRNRLFLDSIATLRNPLSIDNTAKLPPLLFNSVLSKYCQKQNEMDHCHSLAKILLDSELIAKLDSNLSLVVPGGLPYEE